MSATGSRAERVVTSGASARENARVTFRRRRRDLAVGRQVGRPSLSTTRSSSSHEPGSELGEAAVEQDPAWWMTMTRAAECLDGAM